MKAIIRIENEDVVELPINGFNLEFPWCLHEDELCRIDEDGCCCTCGSDTEILDHRALSARFLDLKCKVDELESQLAAARAEATDKKPTYRCFHCGGVFSKQEAAVHFDMDESLPLCRDFCSWDKNEQLRAFHDLSVELDIERDKVGNLMEEVARLKRYSEMKQEMDCYGVWICWFQEDHPPQVIWYQDNGRWDENGCCICDEEWFDTEGYYVGHPDFIGLQMVWYDNEVNAKRIRQGEGGITQEAEK